MKRVSARSDAARDAPPLRLIAVRVPDACRMTGIGRSKLYELIKAGDIATVKVGTITLITVTTLEAFVAGLDSTAT